MRRRIDVNSMDRLATKTWTDGRWLFVESSSRFFFFGRPLPLARKWPPSEKGVCGLPFCTPHAPVCGRVSPRHFLATWVWKDRDTATVFLPLVLAGLPCGRETVALVLKIPGISSWQRLMLDFSNQGQEVIQAPDRLRRLSIQSGQPFAAGSQQHGVPHDTQRHPTIIEFPRQRPVGLAKISGQPRLR